MAALALTDSDSSVLDLEPSVGVLAGDALVRRRVLAALDYDRLPIAGQADTLESFLAAADRGSLRVAVVAAARAETAVAMADAVRDRLSAAIVLVIPGDDRRGMRRALRAGVEAIVPEAHIEVALALTVRVVGAGLSVVPQSLRRQIEPPALTHREREILALLVEGATNAEIAARLTLSVGTVKSHLSSVFAKLEVSDRAAAVARVLELPDLLESPGDAER